jgi:hypothetical protein
MDVDLADARLQGVEQIEGRHVAALEFIDDCAGALALQTLIWQHYLSRSWHYLKL